MSEENIEQKKPIKAWDDKCDRCEEDAWLVRIQTGESLCLKCGMALAEKHFGDEGDVLNLPNLTKEQLQEE